MVHGETTESSHDVGFDESTDFHAADACAWLDDTGGVHEGVVLLVVEIDGSDWALVADRVAATEVEEIPVVVVPWHDDDVPRRAIHDPSLVSKVIEAADAVLGTESNA